MSCYYHWLPEKWIDFVFLFKRHSCSSTEWVCIQENTDVCEEFAHPSLEKRNAFISVSDPSFLPNIPLFPFLSRCQFVCLFLSLCWKTVWCIRVSGFKRWRSFPAEVSSLSSFFLNSSQMIPELTVCLSLLWYLCRKKHCTQHIHLKRATHQFTVVTSDSH